jgi:hypothetical protein
VQGRYREVFIWRTENIHASKDGVPVFDTESEPLNHGSVEEGVRYESSMVVATHCRTCRDAARWSGDLQRLSDPSESASRRETCRHPSFGS